MKKLRLIISTCFILAAGVAISATPKYIFYMIGDGMGIGQVQALRSYFKATDDSVSGVTHFYNFPVASFITTYSHNSDVTDSAAAGTALACGSKTRNGMIGMNADTVALTSVASHLKKAGHGIAIISSVCLDDATPAAFYANTASRGNYYNIAQQGAASGFDFMAGAYFRDPYGKRAGTAGNVFAEYSSAGYSIVRGSNGYEDAMEKKAQRILWLDADTVTENRIGYAIDGPIEDVTLPQMVRCGIDYLYNNYPQGFFMMAEGGAIDHMGHGNDAAGVVCETREFDAAVREAYKFYKQHPDETLIIVTADHETGGLGLAVNNIYALHMKHIDHARISKNEFTVSLKSLFKEKGNAIDWNDIRQFIDEKLGLGTSIALTQEEESSLRNDFEAVINNRGVDVKTLYAGYDQLTSAIFALYSQKLGMGWTTTGHSAAPVPLFVIGAGAEKFAGQGWLDNTDIPRIITEVSGK